MKHGMMPKVQQETADSITIDSIKHPLPLAKDHNDKEFNDVFAGLGDLPGGEYHLQLKEGAVPAQHASRQVPKKKEAYRAELERYVRCNCKRRRPQ